MYLVFDAGELVLATEDDNLVDSELLRIERENEGIIRSRYGEDFYDEVSEEEADFTEGFECGVAYFIDVDYDELEYGTEYSTSEGDIYCKEDIDSFLSKDKDEYDER